MTTVHYDEWTLDPASLATPSPAVPVRRLVAFEAELPWILTVALTRGVELTVGPLRVRAGRGCVLATRDGGSFVGEAFPDEVAQALIDMPREVFGPARHAELYRAIRDVAPDLIPVAPTVDEIAILRRAIDAAWDIGASAAEVTRASEALSEAQSYGRRAVGVAALLRDLDAAEAVADVEPAPCEVAPETKRTVRPIDR